MITLGFQSCLAVLLVRVVRDVTYRTTRLVPPVRSVLSVRGERTVLYVQQMQHNMFDTCIASGYAYSYEGVPERVRDRKTPEGRPGNSEPMGEEGSYPWGD